MCFDNVVGEEHLFIILLRSFCIIFILLFMGRADWRFTKSCFFGWFLVEFK